MYSNIVIVDSTLYPLGSDVHFPQIMLCSLENCLSFNLHMNLEKQHNTVFI